MTPTSSICNSDSIEEIRTAEEAARIRCAAAEAAMLAAEAAGDTEAYDRADRAFAQADDEACHLSVRAEELLEDAEEDDARAERLEQRRAYWSAVL